MTGPLADIDLAILLPFACGALTAVWSIVVISGYLPLRLGPEVGYSFLRMLPICAAVVVIIALIAVLCLTVPLLPTAVAVIVAGLAVLGGPFLVQSMPRRFRNSQLLPVVAFGVSFAALTALPNPF